MIFYHRTTSAEIAAAIVRDGFTDGHGTYLTDREWRGVWLSDRPLDSEMGADKPGALLKLETSPADFSDFEWIEEGKGYREWLIPAETLNQITEAVEIIPEEAQS